MALVVVSAPLPGAALDTLRSHGHQVIVGSEPCGLGHDRLLQTFRAEPTTEALISLLSDRVDGELLQAAPHLRVVANCAVGIDNLDLEALRSRAIIATNTPGVLTEATADLAFALVLDACRNVSRGDRELRAGSWKGWAPGYLLGVRVNGATLGIVGFGRIGQAVAYRARGFSMRVLYHDPHRASTELESATGARFVSLDELLTDSDIVTLHCPLTPQTRGLMSRERLAAMKAGAVLVNTSRGGCVDEPALAQALASGHLAAAGLDVYQSEPNIEPSLRALPNVVLAPHLGSADRPTRESMANMSVQAVLDVLAGREPEHRVA